MALRRDLSRWTAAAFGIGLLTTVFTLAGSSSAADNSPVPTVPTGLDPGPVKPPKPLGDPETTEPPPPPTGFTITGRRTNRVDLQWFDQATLEDGYTVVRRNIQGGGLTMLATLPAHSGTGSYSDTTVLPDRGYCYRVKPFNANGSSQSHERCTYTKSGQPVYRAVLVLRTSTKLQADTVNDVGVRLNSVPSTLHTISYTPNGNLTYLDYGGPDFALGSERRFDLELSGVEDLGDLSLLHISRTGGDDWCVAGLSLEVNNVRVFERSFGDAACRQVGEGANALSFQHDELRAHPLWAGYVPPDPPMEILRTEIESRIEGLVGHFLHDVSAYWGEFSAPRWVEASRKNDRTLAVDLDLAADAVGPNPEVDIDFDLEVSAYCVNDHKAELSIAAKNMQIDVDYDFVTEFIGFVLPCGPIATIIADEPIPSCIESLEGYIEGRVLQSFAPISRQLSFDTDLCASFTPTVLVTATGNVTIGTAPSGKRSMTPSSATVQPVQTTPVRR